MKCIGKNNKLGKQTVGISHRFELHIYNLPITMVGFGFVIKIWVVNIKNYLTSNTVAAQVVNSDQ